MYARSCLIALGTLTFAAAPLAAAVSPKKIGRPEAKPKPPVKKAKPGAAHSGDTGPAAEAPAEPVPVAPAPNPVEAPAVARPAPASATPVAAPLSPPPAAEAPANGASVSEARASEMQPLEADMAKARARNEKERDAAPPPRDGEVITQDHTPRGAMKELAAAIAKRFTARHPEANFHRTAIPYFKNASPNAEKEKVGQLCAEILSVALAEQKRFVIVERERMDQIMKEHRLKDLGVVDEGSAAEFGKILGAQSLVLGTVTEAGASYIVTVRQVDAEKGDVLVSAQVEVERQGLLAISSDAIETRSRMGAGFRSALVPGWGQLYNKQPIKGALFLTAALGVLAAGGTMIGLSTMERNRYALNRPDTVNARERANTYILAANILLISYGVVWAVSIIDALVNGKDHTTFQVATETPAALSF